MKKLTALVLSVVMAASLVACGGSSAPASSAAAPASSAPAASAPATNADGAPTLTSTNPVNIIWSHNAPESSAGHQIALKFKESMESLSGGKITVTIYPNGQLGTVPENDQALRAGEIQMMSGTAGGTTSQTLEYFDAPCLVTSDEEGFELFGRGTELRAYTEKMFEEQGMKVLSFVPGGFRETSSNVKVSSYEELKGLNIRVMENPVPMEYWKNWGCNPTPLAFGELYVGLQQGLVDAQENTYDTITAAKLYEVQKYIINTNHVVMWSGMYMNLDFYNSLPEDYRALLNWVCENIMDDYAYETNKAANEAALQSMKDMGLEVIDFQPEEYVQMRKDAKPAYDLIRTHAGDEVMDMIEKALGM